MTKKIVNSVKYFGLFGLILLSVIACERDFENIGVGLVDNNQFSTKSDTFEVIAYNKNVDTSRVDGIPQYILGVYNDDSFGRIQTSFVSQLGLPASTDFGDNVSIDAVVLDIPYYVTDTSSIVGSSDFKLDSIIGDQEVQYLLSVYESGTFLNTLDPLDPTKGKKYYSTERYERGTTLHSKLFNPDRLDTVLFVQRRFLDNDINTFDTDTIIAEFVRPSIKLALDTTFFRHRFVNQQSSGVFDSFDNFIDYFRGIIIEAKENNTDGGSLMTLNMSDAAITIYYTNTILTTETGIDLNDNDTTDDVDVPIRTKQTMVFPLGGIRASEYDRDYSRSTVGINSRFISPDVINGEDKLYIQGAEGSMAVIDLSKELSLEKLNQIRDENWLINEANLVFYVDGTNKDSVPNQLQLYNFDDNSQILDVFTQAQIGGIGGFLERGSDNKPLKYKFRITDYISEVLKSDDPRKLVKFGLKVFHVSDIPNFQILTDTLNKDFSWIAKGVVLRGNHLLEADENYGERLKLEIFYTINND